MKSTRAEHEQARCNLGDLDAVLKRAEQQFQRLETGRRQRERIERARAEIESLRQAIGWDDDVYCDGYVDTRRREVSGRRDTARDEAGSLDRKRKEKEDELRSFGEAGDLRPPEIQHIAIRLGAETAAEKFENIAIEDAGVQEARLGPLANAVLVDDPQGAARTVAGIEGRPESVWLARPEALARDRHAEESASESIGKSVIVQSSRNVWRVTKVPDHPTLGRGAREKKIEALEGELAKIRPAAQLLDERRQKIDAELGALDELGLKLNDIENGRRILADLGIDDASETAIEAARTRLAESQREHSKANDLLRSLERNWAGSKGGSTRIARSAPRLRRP